MHHSQIGFATDKKEQIKKKKITHLISCVIQCLYYIHDYCSRVSNIYYLLKTFQDFRHDFSINLLKLMSLCFYRKYDGLGHYPLTIEMF